MKKAINKSVAVAATAILLGGCVHYAWVKPGGDPSTYGADNYACLQTSNYQAPPVFQQYDYNPYQKNTSQVNSVCTKNGATTSCQTNTVDKQKDFSQPGVVDLNSNNRADLWNACMQAHGWVYQAFEDNPQSN